jgi:hypothetical protein
MALTDKITMTQAQITTLITLAQNTDRGHADFRRVDGRDDGTDRAALDIADAADYLAGQYARLATLQAEIGAAVAHGNPTGEVAHYRGLCRDWLAHADDRAEKRRA